MKKLIFNDFFCRTGIKIPAKPDKKSTKKIFKKPRKPLNNLMKKISGNYCNQVLVRHNAWRDHVFNSVTNAPRLDHCIGCTS